MSRWTWFAIGATVALVLGLTARGDELGVPNLKTEHFTIMEQTPNVAVGVSEPRQETKDVKAVYVLIVYAEVSEAGTQAILGRIHLDCTLQKAKYDIGYRLGANGVVIGEMQPRTTDWQDVHPNSPTGELFSYVCKRDPSPAVDTKIGFMDGVPTTPIPPRSPKGESWDQENLKRNDHGCPTAVYIAPNGVLEQCP